MQDSSLTDGQAKWPKQRRDKWKTTFGCALITRTIMLLASCDFDRGLAKSKDVCSYIYTHHYCDSYFKSRWVMSLKGSAGIKIVESFFRTVRTVWTLEFRASLLQDVQQFRALPFVSRNLIIMHACLAPSSRIGLFLVHICIIRSGWKYHCLNESVNLELINWRHLVPMDRLCKCFHINDSAWCNSSSNETTN